MRSDDLTRREEVGMSTLREDRTEPMPAVEQIRAAALRIQLASATKADCSSRAIRSAAATIHQAAHAVYIDLQPQLQRAISRFDSVGFAPSLTKALGLSDIEKPLNRLLGWWADEYAEHQMARCFLVLLANTLGFSSLGSDVRLGLPVSVYCEQTLPNSTTGRQPDLVIVSPSAALLIENKVHAPESGPAQYSDYLEEFLCTFLLGRECRAILCARDTTSRELPPGYASLLSHGELAELFLVLAADAASPAWGRIAAVLCARAFRPPERHPSLTRAKQLAASDPASVSTCTEMRALLQQLNNVPLLTPWHGDQP